MESAAAAFFGGMIHQEDIISSNMYHNVITRQDIFRIEGIYDDVNAALLSGDYFRRHYVFKCVEDHGVYVLLGYQKSLDDYIEFPNPVGFDNNQQSLDSADSESMDSDSTQERNPLFIDTPVVNQNEFIDSLKKLALENNLKVINLIENTQVVKDFFNSSVLSNQFKSGDERFCTALKDMLLIAAGEISNGDSGLMIAKMSIALGNCQTPVINAVQAHSICLRIGDNEEITEDEYERLAVQDYLQSTNGRDQVGIPQGEGLDQIEIVNGLINAVFSDKASTLNKGAFQVESERNKFQSLSAHEFFGYSQITQDMAGAFAKIICQIDKADNKPFFTNEGKYILDNNKLLSLTQAYKNKLGIVSAFDKQINVLCKNIQEYINQTFERLDDTFSDVGLQDKLRWYGMGEMQKKAEVITYMRELQDQFPNYSLAQRVELCQKKFQDDIDKIAQDHENGSSNKIVPKPLFMEQQSQQNSLGNNHHLAPN